MAYIIAEPCVNEQDRACVDVCPVDCIYEVEDTALKDGHPAKKPMLYIHPEECIDCGACEPECPVEAIFPEDEVPEKWNEFIAYNYQAFDLEHD